MRNYGEKSEKFYLKKSKCRREGGKEGERKKVSKKGRKMVKKKEDKELYLDMIDCT